MKTWVYLLQKYDPKLKQYIPVAVCQGLDAARTFVKEKGGIFSSLGRHPNERTYSIQAVEYYE